MEKFSLFMMVDRPGLSNPSGCPLPVAARSKAWVCGRSLDETADSNPAVGMIVSCECCVLSDRGLRVILINRPEESYRAWCV